MPPPAHDVREALRLGILALGFRRVGFSPAESPAGAREHLMEWLAHGYHAGMGWMARDPEVRASASIRYPWARTVICCALPYRTREAAQPEVQDGRARARISTYALGRDYHKVVRRRLLRGARLVEAHGGRACCAVDHSPILEKAYHERAGVGWIGKNACLIDPDGGSYILLGEIVTDLALPPDQPARDLCGGCTLCLEACPTSALAGPRRLDSARCISYLTIENPGAVETGLQQFLGDHVFGCDICQDVCPWNRDAPTDGVHELRPLPGRRRPLLAALARLTSEGWDRYVSGSALRRAGYAGFLRSVALALRNSDSQEATSALGRLRHHESRLVREAAGAGEPDSR